MTNPKLHQCPCEPASKCVMDEPCLGCEEYGRWLNNQKREYALIDKYGEITYKTGTRKEIDDHALVHQLIVINDWDS